MGKGRKEVKVGLGQAYDFFQNIFNTSSSIGRRAQIRILKVKAEKNEKKLSQNNFLHGDKFLKFLKRFWT